MTHEEEFRTYMKAANSTSGNDDESHLSEPMMIAYCRGEMTEAERETAQAHLAVCTKCIALFRSARDFVVPARAGEEEVTATETDQAWQSVIAHVQDAEATDAGKDETNVVQAEFERLRDRKFLMDSRVSLALAACLLISFGALGWVAWRLWREKQSQRQSQEVAVQMENKQRELEQRLSQLEQSGGDQLKRERDQRLAAETKRDELQTQLAAAQQTGQNIPVYSAILSSDRGAQDDVQLNFTSASQLALLRLLISKPYEFPEYSIDLLGQRGEIVREFSGLRPTGDDGALSVLLNRATLNGGNYKLRLFGQQGKTKKQIGEYGMLVTVGR